MAWRKLVLMVSGLNGGTFLQVNFPYLIDNYVHELKGGTKQSSFIKFSHHFNFPTIPLHHEKMKDYSSWIKSRLFKYEIV